MNKKLILSFILIILGTSFVLSANYVWSLYVNQMNNSQEMELLYLSSIGGALIVFGGILAFIALKFGEKENKIENQNI